MKLCRLQYYDVMFKAAKFKCYSVCRLQRLTETYKLQNYNVKHGKLQIVMRNPLGFNITYCTV